MSFQKLDKKELLRTAEDDFAVEVDRSWPKTKIIDALNTSGVSFVMYLEQNPDQAVLLSEVPVNVQSAPVVVVAAPPVVVEEEQKILIKMLRENPLYQIGKYRWTKTHPYVLVGVKDAEHVLINEEGFRQATPGELQEYYA